MAGFDTFNWTCPYCDRAQTVTSLNASMDDVHVGTKQSGFGSFSGRIITIACANENCLKPTVTFELHEDTYSSSYGGSYSIKSGNEMLFHRRLLPEHLARPQPDFIPKPLREDYREACLIRDLSPKASATLARRCLQGMIRDFCKIAKATLDAEIKELRNRFDNGTAPRTVSDESITAIDRVRKVGNIGAHMEKDINLVVDVDPDEAQLLIELIETLFDEWYVAADRRSKRLKAIDTLAASKEQARQLPPPTPVITK